MRTSITIEWNDKHVVALFNSSEFVKSFNTHFSHEGLGFISHAKGLLRDQVNLNKYPPLGITQYIAAAGPKPAMQTLRDTGGLLDSFHGHFVRESDTLSGLDFVFEGNTKSGMKYADLAKMLEEGMSWNPTQIQRFVVAIKAKASGAPEPEGSPKPQWSYPPRPFVSDTFTRHDVLQSFFDHVRRAVVLAFEERGRASR